MHRSAEGRRVNKGGVRVQACLKKERKKGTKKVSCPYLCDVLLQDLCNWCETLWNTGK
jgi:hypothetical protein